LHPFRELHDVIAGRDPWLDTQTRVLEKRYKELSGQVTVVVQVDGKVRGRLQVGVDAADDQVRQLALGDDRVKPWVERRRIDKVVVVPNRLVNIVTRA
jgi:leucyl-tRNA synthetase